MSVESLLEIPLGIYPGVDPMIVLCLAFWVITQLFSIVAAVFYIPISCAQGFQFLHGLPCGEITLGVFCLLLFYFYL